MSLPSYEVPRFSTHPYTRRVLTGVKIIDVSSLQKALKALHEQYRVPNIVMSSIPLKPWLQAILPLQSLAPQGDEAEDDDFLVCISSSQEVSTEGGLSVIHAGRVPFIRGYFVGVGDLFSAFVIAHYKPSSPFLSTNAQPLDSASGETALSCAVSAALTKTHGILKVTDEYAKTLPENERQPTDDEMDEEDNERKVRRMKGRELRLIQSQHVIRGTHTLTERKMTVWSNFWSL